MSTLHRGIVFTVKYFQSLFLDLAHSQNTNSRCPCTSGNNHTINDNFGIKWNEMFIKSILPFFTILLFIFFFTTAAFAANKDYHNFLPFFDEAVAINIFLQIITINTVLKVTAAVSGHLSFSLKLPQKSRGAWLPPAVPGRLTLSSSCHQQFQGIC